MKPVIPPPPDVNAQYFSMDECAGFLRVTRAFWDALRRTDPTLPQPHKLTSGTLRMPRRDLEKWVEQLPRGWSSMGGRRARAFGRDLPAADEAVAVGKET